VYRALDFLLDAGLIHRIDTLNAFIGCTTPEEQHTGQLLICRSCNRVTELDDPSITRLLALKARNAGFTSDQQSVEIKGLCADCQS
jgi:Fur family zinc uptake transcriptional regulator